MKRILSHLWTFTADLLALMMMATALWFAAAALGQQVDSSQIKAKTNGGITGDTANALTVAVYRGTSAPSSPVTGQLWCDTSFTPCILKTYTGSAWVIPPGDASVPIQEDLSTFPANPTDGQMFFSRAPPAIFIYDETNTRWLRLAGLAARNTADAVDVYSTSVITPPSSTLTATQASSCGTGMTTGTRAFVVTFYNSTGGETTQSSDSNTITFSAATDCANLSSIPTGGTGTTGRRIYESKANVPSGEKYLVAQISDNTTTSLNNVAVAETAKVTYPPQVNFSAPVPTGWTMQDWRSGGAVGGGCGCTADATMRCKSANGPIPNTPYSTSDLSLIAYRDLSSYNSGNYTIRFRIVVEGAEPPTYLADWACNGTNSCASAIWGFRYGSAAGNITWWETNSQYIQTRPSACLPPSAGNPLGWSYSIRQTPNVASSRYNTWSGVPPFTAWPLYITIKKRGAGYYNAYRSLDGEWWTPISPTICSGSGVSEAACSFDWSAYGLFDRFELPFDALIGSSSGNSCANQVYNMVIEIDQFTITQD